MPQKQEKNADNVGKCCKPDLNLHCSYEQWCAQASAGAGAGAGAKWRYEGTIVDRGGVVTPSVRGITIHHFIMILCHVGFSILQAV